MITGCNLLIYFLVFVPQSLSFSILSVEPHVAELVYTMLITIFLYVIILKVNQRLETLEKRSASKFV